MVSPAHRASIRKHVVKPLYLSIGLFIVVGLWRYFDSVWQAAPSNANPLDSTRFIIFAIAIATGAIILSTFSIFTPAGFRSVARILGWDEPQPTDSGGALRSVLAPNEPLQCPKCKSTTNFQQRGLVDVSAGGELKIWGKGFGFSDKKRAESLWCNQCGYAFYRLVEA